VRLPRYLPWPVLLLALAVVATQLLLWWLAPAPKPRVSAGPPRSGYTLENFSLDVLNEDGRVGARMRAPRLQRRDGDGSLYIDAPQFELPAETGSPWQGHSDYAWVAADGSLLKLQGAVHMQRPASTVNGSADIATADVSAWPDEHRLQTAAPTAIREPGRILSGTGMKADLANHTLELLADVHGTFQPAPAH
jgi:lipopolysaccharide export system protein LptC